MKAATFPYYEALNKVMAELITDKTKKDYQSAGLSPKRLRWDALWYAINKGVLPGDFFPRAYGFGLNDGHIDTALKKATCTKDTWTKRND